MSEKYNSLKTYKSFKKKLGGSVKSLDYNFKNINLKTQYKKFTTYKSFNISNDLKRKKYPRRDSNP